MNYALSVPVTSLTMAASQVPPRLKELLIEATQSLLHPFPSDMVVMQYTGLTDKNGVEIYEGDVVRLKQMYDGDRLIAEQSKAVVFEDGCFTTDSWIDLDSACLNGRVEVIGNIYEHPELLKEAARAAPLISPRSRRRRFCRFDC